MRRDNLSQFLIVDVYYSQLEAHIKRVRTLQKFSHSPSLSAETNLQDIDFQSCRFFLCPKNAPNLAPTHSYGRFQIQHIQPCKTEVAKSIIKKRRTAHCNPSFLLSSLAAIITSSKPRLPFPEPSFPQRTYKHRS